MYSFACIIRLIGLTQATMPRIYQESPAHIIDKPSKKWEGTVVRLSFQSVPKREMTILHPHLVPPKARHKPHNDLATQPLLTLHGADRKPHMHISVEYTMDDLNKITCFGALNSEYPKGAPPHVPHNGAAKWPNPTESESSILQATFWEKKSFVNYKLIVWSWVDASKCQGRKRVDVCRGGAFFYT